MCVLCNEGDNQLAILKSARPWDIRADVHVNLGNQVIFQGFDSRIPLHWPFEFISAWSGNRHACEWCNWCCRSVVKIEAYGQSLDLNRAIARFNGPLANPTLDIDANKSVQGSTVGVRVTGTASSPEYSSV